MGAYPTALDYYQRALPLFRALGNRAGEAKPLNNLGIVYDDLGDYSLTFATSITMAANSAISRLLDAASRLSRAVFFAEMCDCFR